MWMGSIVDDIYNYRYGAVLVSVSSGFDGHQNVVVSGCPTRWWWWGGCRRWEKVVVKWVSHESSSEAN